MRSRINRGTPRTPRAGVRPGAGRLVPRRGLPHRASARRGRARAPLGPRDAHRRLRPELARLPHAQGRVKALAFTLSRRSPSHTGALPDGELVDILRTANGRYGSTLSYLVETAQSLRGCGIRDRDVERLVALARRHALTA